MAEKNLPDRKSERFKNEDPIQFAVAQDPTVFSSKASNCSQDGICFESEVSLSPGTVVFIAAEGDIRYYRAEVKWADKQEGKGQERYIVGANTSIPCNAEHSDKTFCDWLDDLQWA
jgi:hypothetical protein